ncbi:hypothetical protein CDAR_176321 [Caerostris darwini]|uniref:Uncharacterized protein n=1 Tax=Caerostris darwini TaxID=1538125 RepID=A0AAV4NXK1_9ARAC|nr:hypothetical protein CDAR_176321 [Caerostris darwini]
MEANACCVSKVPARNNSDPSFHHSQKEDEEQEDDEAPFSFLYLQNIDGDIACLMLTSIGLFSTIRFAFFRSELNSCVIIYITHKFELQ